MNALIVEDDLVSRTLIEEITRKSGFKVTACEDAEKAWEAYLEGSFDLILLDINLPGMNGLDFSRRVRTSPMADKVFILAITTRDQIHDLQQSLDYGIDDYLSKPFHEKDLSMRLAIAVKKIYEIGEREKIEKILRYSGEYIRSLLCTTLDVVLILDAKSNVVYSSPSVQSILGYSANDLARKSLFAYIHTDDIDKLKEEFEKGKRNPVYHPFVSFRLKHSASDWIAFDSNSTFVFDDSGISHIIINLRDVSGRNIEGDDFHYESTIEGEPIKIENILHSKKSLAEKIEILQSIIDSINDGIAVADINGNLLLFNKAAEKIMGVGISDPSSESWFETYGLFYPDKVTPVLQKDLPLMKAIQGETVNNFEIFVRNPHLPEGTFVSVNAVPLLSKEFTLEGGVAVFRDISEKKNAEFEREQIEVMFRQHQKLEAIGELAAGIAHEINTPIQYIGDNTRFIQESWGDIIKLLNNYESLITNLLTGVSKKKDIYAIQSLIKEIELPYLSIEIPKALEQSLSGISHVANIVRSMKEFSHPSSKEMKKVDINQALEDTVNVSRNEWKYIADIELDLEPGSLMVDCFPGELNQVFLNLLINAAHAIDDSRNSDNEDEKGKIQVRTRKNGSRVEILISDTGGGIPDEVKNKIYDPFFTTKEVGRGTGQGLSIAHSVIVEKHSGKINCESQVGKGTTFIIQLPINRDVFSLGGGSGV